MLNYDEFLLAAVDENFIEKSKALKEAFDKSHEAYKEKPDLHENPVHTLSFAFYK
jgi:hypothetical protein